MKMWSDRDLALALQLQDQFNSEDVPIVRQCSPIKKHNQSFSNLANPDLEFIDPTPNVYNLFQQFDKRFFWSSLSTVSVRWSKRMTSCAGICRYQPRSGFCEISLSEPLLKLRQRKDLVETLLHEMIHAFLFVTENDRDRDGHGPNFHKHMYRINEAANVKITVYHSFIDEVHHYQTHWWRCNGPCQNRKPWFGIIRRAQNRAPGPKDFWWNQHKMTCGGTFIKVKEPDMKKNKSSKNSATNNGKIDIRTYFSPTKLNNLSTIENNKNVPANKKLKLDSSVPAILNKDGNVKNLIPQKRKDKSNSVPHSKVDINDKRKRNTKSNLPSHNRVETNNKNDYNEAPKGIQNKIDINSKTDKKPVLPLQNTVNVNKPIMKNPESNIPRGNVSKNQDNVRETVRNHWASKFSSTQNIEKPMLDEKQTTNMTNQKNIDLKVESKDFFTELNCPLCNKFLRSSELDRHIQSCLEVAKFNDIFESTSSDTVDFTSSTKELESEAIPSTSNVSDNLRDCPVCEKQIRGSNLAEHLEECLNTTFDEDEKDCFSKNDVSIISLSDSEDEDCNNLDKSVIRVPCPCCYEMIEESIMNDHLDQCLL